MPGRTEMNKKKCSFKLIGYELRNINGNFMTHFFGIVFPNIKIGRAHV